MNWLKKGPELKKPNFEVPGFLGDLYYDMRERRLLPLVALAIVAIIAVPFLIGSGSEAEEPSGGAGGVAIAGGSASGAPPFTVVESKPGLRDYHKRLNHRSPTDPFKQRHTNSGLGNAQLNEPTDEETTVTIDEGSGSTTTIETETRAPSGNGGKPGLVFFAWAIDLSIKKSVPTGSGAEQQAEGLGTAKGGATQGAPVELASEPETTVRHDVLPQTRLPGDKVPVATYMGPSKKGFPLFLVSSKVKSVFGESKCVSGDDSCQLLEVPLKFPITFVYGPNDVRYTFNVSKIELVVTGHG
ncbi:MAG TPA: hypothetical protein VIT85_05080 [Solirubrobacterales bacterium]